MLTDDETIERLLQQWNETLRFANMLGSDIASVAHVAKELEEYAAQLADYAKSITYVKHGLFKTVWRLYDQLLEVEQGRGRNYEH